MMRIGFYLFLIFERLISLLPYKLLYIFSDFLYFILFYIIRYRKEIVYSNLQNSFPNKSNKELKTIRRKFYRSLTDVILESIKSTHSNINQLKKRFTIIDNNIIEKLILDNKSAFIMVGHTANWELGALLFPEKFRVKIHAVYQQQSNPYFDAYIKKMRSRFGVIPVTSKQALRKFAETKHELTFNMIVGDQAPLSNIDNYWTTFLNQETAFFTGTEKMAKSLDYAVVFASISRVKRGYYEANLKLITDKPKETGQYEITEKYVRYLEQYINENPDSWLWSHRRWKRKRINN